MQWITPDAEPLPRDVPILAELDGGACTCCAVDDQGWLWQLAAGAGTVGCCTQDDVARYVLLEDLIGAIEDAEE